MLLKISLFVCLFVVIECAFEGDLCTKDGQTGTCMLIGKCRSALEDIKNRKNPKICGFVSSDPIVCCLDNVIPTVPTPFNVATTTKRPATAATTEYVPPVYDYEDNTNKNGGCSAIPAQMTSNKTGRKAFDKCIEYQEQFVYPCERGVALTGELSRSNHCHHNADELIIGGTDTSKDEFPHMVMLGYGDDDQSIAWLCGGAVISDRFILTAGHCTASREQGPATYALVGALTRSDAQQKSKWYRVKRIIKHPEYKPPVKYNDIALLETEKQIQLSQFVVPACLHVGDPIDDERVLATGWGLTTYQGSESEAMQKVILHKFTTPECSEKYQPMRLMKIGFDPQSQTCYGDKTQPKDTCQGDSGGPIQIKSKKIHCMYTIVGVTSFGRACGFPGQPAIYTRVANYVPWIESIVWP
ncbi:venom protease-like [Anticarsia gemmatalis]|uniref:venom protease-like n=1 Tax=Anticarsia gemmatalis TaxID=129554 RepID=UPI003F770DAD